MKSSVALFWSDPEGQQISGYLLLTGCVLTLGFSIRKRLHRFSGGCLASARFVHAALGLFAAFLFIAHTGLSFGHQLNLVLSWNFLLVILVGALTLVSGRERRRSISPALAWPGVLHLLLFWSLVVLTTFHVFAVYYF